MHLERTLIETEDGSHTLFVSELNEPYHSVHGAIQESRHVFIRKGFQEAILSKTGIHILEMGFGTGLNALLTLAEAQKHHISVKYTGIEAYPVEAALVALLNYPKMVDDGKWQDEFTQIHEAPWGKPVSITPGFTLEKIQTSLLKFTSTETYDLIYFDAFAPEVQPELWTQEIFEKLAGMMSPGGLLTTYCCKGYVKRNLKAAGFAIEKLPGPPGKREMLRGKIGAELLSE